MLSLFPQGKSCFPRRWGGTGGTLGLSEPSRACLEKRELTSQAGTGWRGWGRAVIVSRELRPAMLCARRRGAEGCGGMWRDVEGWWGMRSDVQRCRVSVPCCARHGSASTPRCPRVVAYEGQSGFFYFKQPCLGFLEVLSLSLPEDLSICPAFPMLFRALQTAVEARPGSGLSCNHCASEQAVKGTNIWSALFQSFCFVPDTVHTALIRGAPSIYQLPQISFVDSKGDRLSWCRNEL